MSWVFKTKTKKYFFAFNKLNHHFKGNILFVLCLHLYDIKSFVRKQKIVFDVFFAIIHTLIPRSNY